MPASAPALPALPEANQPLRSPLELPSRMRLDRKGRPYETKFEPIAYGFLQKKAADREVWEGVLERAYGSDYDHEAGEHIRTRIVAGDFGWAPQVELVSPEVLGEAGGAYSHARNVVYLNESVTHSTIRAFIYVEELGHALDTIVRTTDAPGDEGALFRIAIMDERYQAAVLEKIAGENDHGFIVVDGEQVEVEYLFDWLGQLFDWAISGIKSGAGWIWKGATSAGSAIVKAAQAGWYGATVLAGWLQYGIEATANALVAQLQRTFWATYQELQTRINSLVTLGYGSLEAVKIMGMGLQEIARGNLIDGVTAINVGLAKLAVEVPLDTLSTYVIEEISNLQTLVGLEPVGRYLSDWELYSSGASFYGWTESPVWWLYPVRVKEGFAGVWSLNPRPFTVETTIYLKNWPYSDGLMAHELTHVWQYIHGGGDYKINSLHEQWQHGDAAYGWEPWVDAGYAWWQLGVESQAAFVEAAYTAGCYSNWLFGGSCIIHGVDRNAFFGDVWTNLRQGWGAP